MNPYVWIAGMLAGLSLAAGTAAFELGAPPVRHEPQDARDWVRAPVPRAAPTRSQVAALYTNTYLPGNAVALVWNGSVPGCMPGTTNPEHQQAVIDRINYYRALVDLPPVTLLTGAPVAQSQAAALMMSANNALSHTPPASWLCFSADGATGAANTNLALGINGPAAVDGFMTDAGAGNNAVGHRRWLLHPPRSAMATGDVPGGNQPPRPANAIFVFGPQNPRPATPNGVAWPPAGFVPYQNLPAASNRWSFSFPGANFAAAQVTMEGPAGPIAVTLEPLATGFGDNTIVFLPAGFDYGKPANDTQYTVRITGMTGSGVPPSIQYTVTVIDPAVAGAPTVAVVEFYNQSLDHYFVTWVEAEIANLDAGNTPTRWTRTGKTLRVYTTPQAGTTPICRIYIIPLRGDSHFYGRGVQECGATMAKHPDFIMEEPNFMHMFLPVAGVCPAGTVEVYRVFSNRPDANHRYMIEVAVRTAMEALGWLAEGDGPNLVVLCAPA
ncbi:MAG: CAP domain-containing protein [Burkholderiales bacterium]|nr:CAP domain-containing protein [Burkholderiales bacterium]